MNDARIIEATKDMMRIIIRRPHAYKFRRDHPGAAIPCLGVMDGDGNFLGGVAVPSADAVARLLKRIDKHKALTKKAVRKKRVL